MTLLLDDIVVPTPLAPARLGLLSSVPVHDVVIDDQGNATVAGTNTPAVDVAGDPWRGAAITFTPEPCGSEGGTYDPGCGATVDISGDKTTVQPTETFQSVGVYEPESCSTFGWAGVDVVARSKRALYLDEGRQMERELWTGTTAKAIGSAEFLSNRWLARNSAGPGGFPPAVTQPKGSTAQTPVRALAELEEAIAEGRAGGRCLIHASRRTVTYWTYGSGLVYRQGNVLLTYASDSIVVPGEGYDGSAPDGSLDATRDTAWVYATGPIEIFRTNVETVVPMGPEETASNRRTAIAKRQFAFLVDPCVYVGIKVTHSL